MDTIGAQVLAHADELMLDAPGRVNVRRIHEITEVRASRAARDALTEEEKQALIQLRLETIERLDGAVSIERPKIKEKKLGLIGSLLSPLFAAAGGLGADVRAKSEFEHLARQAGVPNRLPAPTDLIDAAEMWAVSHLVAGRVDVDLEALRRPWQEASIASE